MIFKKDIHCIKRTEHVLEELDICAIKVYMFIIIILKHIYCIVRTYFY